MTSSEIAGGQSEVEITEGWSDDADPWLHVDTPYGEKIGEGEAVYAKAPTRQSHFEVKSWAIVENATFGIGAIREIERLVHGWWVSYKGKDEKEESVFFPQTAVSWQHPASLGSDGTVLRGQFVEDGDGYILALLGKDEPVPCQGEMEDWLDAYRQSRLFLQDAAGKEGVE